jgi:hypothetical protein
LHDQALVSSTISNLLITQEGRMLENWGRWHKTVSEGIDYQVKTCEILLKTVDQIREEASRALS